MKIDRYRVVMSISTAIILALLAWLGNILVSDTRAVGVYQNLTVEPVNDGLCPGDTVTYSQTVDYRDTPAIVMIVGSVWSIDDQETVVYETQPRWVNYTEPAKIVGGGEWTIPWNFPPGTYERRLAGQAMGRDPQMFSVRFTVVSDCT